MDSRKRLKKTAIAFASATAFSAGTAFGATSPECSALTAGVRDLINPTTQATLLTPWASEADGAIRNYGFTSDQGVLFYAATKTGTGLVPVYRLFQPTTLDFLWTQSESERTSAIKNYGYQDQNNIFYVPGSTSTCTQTVHRLRKGSMHRYVVTDAARAALIASGWIYETVAFNGGKAPGDTTTDDPPPPPPPPPPPVTKVDPEAEPVIDMSLARMKSAGAARLGTTSYPVPASGVYYVATNGSDNTGKGTKDAPYGSLQKAVSAAPAGSTIVLRAGSYHEKDVHIAKKLTVQSYANEIVWLDGSVPVTNWVKNGALWVGSGLNHPPFKASVDYSGALSASDSFVDPNYPMAAHPDQVWIDGVAQTQVQSQSLVKAGTFFYDETTSKLYLGSDPTGHVVRASDLQRAIYVTADAADGSVFRGFGVRRYAPSIDTFGAVVSSRTVITNPATQPLGITFENMVISDNATTGLAVTGNNVLINHVTAARNGLMGFLANEADRLAMRNSLAVGNNTEHFKPSPSSGGFKTTHTRGIEVSNSVFLQNYGPGLWFDESEFNMFVFNNDAVGNKGSHGIIAEISDTILLANNLVVGNDGNGFKINNTSNVTLWNNTAANNGVNVNGTYNLWVVNDSRRYSNCGAQFKSACALRNDASPPSTMTWQVGPVVSHNNVIMGGSGQCQVCYQDGVGNLPAAKMVAGPGSTDNNVYLSNSSTNWAIWSPSTYTAQNWTKFVTETKQEASSILATTAPLDTTYKLVPAVSSLVNTKAAALPADIANRIGQASGAKQLGVWWPAQ